MIEPQEVEFFPHELVCFNDQCTYDTVEEATRLTGLGTDHIWAVVDDGGNSDVWTYCPSHHWVNLLHYVVTKEPHDNNTYISEMPRCDHCDNLVEILHHPLGRGMPFCDDCQTDNNLICECCE